MQRFQAQRHHLKSPEDNFQEAWQPGCTTGHIWAMYLFVWKTTGIEWFLILREDQALQDHHMQGGLLLGRGKLVAALCKEGCPLGELDLSENPLGVAGAKELAKLCSH